MSDHHGVTADMIRQALGTFDPGDAISNEQIELHIEIGETIVDAHASNGISTALLKAALIDVAKHRVVSKNRTTFAGSISSQSSSTDFDVDEYLGDLRMEKEEALELVSTDSPSFATAGDRTKGMW